jgi:hypothetical protein
LLNGTFKTAAMVWGVGPELIVFSNSIFVIFTSAYPMMGTTSKFNSQQQFLIEEQLLGRFKVKWHS